MKLGVGLACCSVLLVGTACQSLERWLPCSHCVIPTVADARLSTGVIVRPASGRWIGFTEDVHFPTTRIRVAVPVEQRWDVYGQFDVINGRVALTEGILTRTGRGDMQAVGAGVLYRVMDHLRIDAGAEVFHIDFAVHTTAGPLGYRLSDTVYGWNVNLGLVADLPLTDRLSLELGGGYMVGQNWSDEFDLDFDGVYWTGALRFGLD